MRSGIVRLEPDSLPRVAERLVVIEIVGGRERGGHFAAGGRFRSRLRHAAHVGCEKQQRDADGEDRELVQHYQETACPNPAARARVSARCAATMSSTAKPSDL